MDNKAASDKHENNGADNSSGNRIATSEIPVKNSKEEQAVHSSLTTTTTTAAISVLSSGDTSSVATKMTGSPPITRDISNPLLPPRSLTVDGNTPATSHRISNNAPEETFIVPDNFALVAPFIYRSSFPKRKNFSFFKRVGIKSVL
ncbi:hypothetical protein BDF22DRAFT_694431 [Syncephalis plumigaleata]|nr:hypothetical protein BDF22DRAFT_694431 [Syncephalis plumigaleata]